MSLLANRLPHEGEGSGSQVGNSKLKTSMWITPGGVRYCLFLLLPTVA